MKFKAALHNCRQLNVVCNTIKQFLRCAVIKLDPTRMRFIATAGPAGGRSHVDGAQVWCALNTSAFFSDLRLESRSNGGSIYLDVPDIRPLSFALKACEKASGPVIMKLAQHGDRQLLTLSMNHAQTGHDALHEVPIRVMTESEVQAIAMPPMETDAVSVRMPPLHEVSAVAERMRMAGASHVELSLTYCPSNDRCAPPHPPGVFPADARGSYGHDDDHDHDATPQVTKIALTLTADAHAMVIAVRWSELLHRPQADDSGAALQRSALPVTVTVDVRRFCRFFTVRDIVPIDITAHVVNQRALVLSVYADGDTNFVFYLPALLVH